MKRLPFLTIILIVVFGLPILLWAVRTDNADVRSRADLSTTPTITPSVTPSPTVTPTPTITPTITPTPTNSPPRCTGLSVSPGSGVKPLTVTFACAGYDPDNDITAVEFGFGGSEKRLVEKGAGQFGSITTTYTYTQAGTYNTTCRVRDNNQAFSSYPSYCTYTVVVTENSLTPTPRRTPTPSLTPTSAATDEPLLFFGNQPTVTTAPTATPAITALPTVTPAKESWFTGEKMAQLVMMVIVSGITIIVALLLHGFFDKR
ncbi:MAG: hypothetical protein ACOY3M_05995 [Patescibacteria group bacterium]